MEGPGVKGEKVLRGSQADTKQELISTERIGTSMSARHIPGLEKVPRVRLFAY